MSEENKEIAQEARKAIQVSGFTESIAPLVEQDLNLSVKSEPDSLKLLHSVLSETQKEFVLSLRAKTHPSQFQQILQRLSAVKNPDTLVGIIERLRQKFEPSMILDNFKSQK